MWLDKKKFNDSAIEQYQQLLLSSCPNHIVIDGLFDETQLDEVLKILQQPDHWQTQRHTYSALYVDSAQWQNTPQDQRFVQRDVWRREAISNSKTDPTIIKPTATQLNKAQAFLSFLRGDEFMSVLSRIFNVQLTDMHVAEPAINTNYFRLSADDFVEQHADDSPGREVCMLLYLNKDWNTNAGGELRFTGNGNQNSGPIAISPLYNRCVLFNPASKGSEHWVNKLNSRYTGVYRYNLTSWYWSK